jgi:hypothetical protein
MKIAAIFLTIWGCFIISVDGQPTTEYRLADSIDHERNTLLEQRMEQLETQLKNSRSQVDQLESRTG